MEEDRLREELDREEHPAYQGGQKDQLEVDAQIVWQERWVELLAWKAVMSVHHVLEHLFLLVQMGCQAPVGAGTSNPGSAFHASYQSHATSLSIQPSLQGPGGHVHRGAQLESHRAAVEDGSESNSQVFDRRMGTGPNGVADETHPALAVVMMLVMSAISCPHPTSMALRVGGPHPLSMVSCRGVHGSALRDQDALGPQTARDQAHLWTNDRDRTWHGRYQAEVVAHAQADQANQALGVVDYHDRKDPGSAHLEAVSWGSPSLAEVLACRDQMVDRDDRGLEDRGGQTTGHGHVH